ncbi:VOC family protein [Arthrobacter sp. CG_A4]|uniref:VOC family protein n=1 Tax=Arthrobacter sp. CG_A4 TaxID=3071706 RepID=UPI002E106BE4
MALGMGLMLDDANCGAFPRNLRRFGRQTGNETGEFHRDIFGQLRREPIDDFVILQPPGGPGTCVSLDRVPATLQIPPRLHLDLYTDQQDAEVQRLLALGATRVEWGKRPADADHVILADPEGNRFCVVETAGTGNSPSSSWGMPPLVLRPHPGPT